MQHDWLMAVEEDTQKLWLQYLSGGFQLMTLKLIGGTTVLHCVLLFVVGMAVPTLKASLSP